MPFKNLTWVASHKGWEKKKKLEIRKIATNWPWFLEKKAPLKNGKKKKLKKKEKPPLPLNAPPP